MRRGIGLVFLAVFILSVMFFPHEASSGSMHGEDIARMKGRRVEHLDNQILVRFRGDDRPFRVIEVPRGRVFEEIEGYKKNPNVVMAQPNYCYYAMMVPNDPYYGYQWHLSDIQMEAAWDISTGSGVIVAVVDTGIRKGTDLANTLFAPGYDFYNNDSNPTDDNGHGTHVAGTIAQSTNNSSGVAGVAYNCTLMPVKVLSATGGGTSSTVASGIEFAANNGADIINLSLGGPAPDYIVREAVDTAYGLGVTIIAAAGNEGLDTCGDPAAYDACVIAVGATRYDETLSYYSNYGTSLDLVAPGGDVNVDQNGDGYADGVLQQTFQKSSFRITWGYYFFQGTSMATPHVAGVAALVIAKELATTGNLFTPDEVRAALQETAKDLGDVGRDNTYGHGLVNALAALNYTPVPNTPPVADAGGIDGFYEGIEDEPVTFDGSGSYDPDGDSLTYSWDFGDGSTGTGVSPSHTYTAGGEYTVTLVVNDGRADSESAEATVHITEVNDPPVAVAGPDQSVYVGDTVSFDGSGSNDIDGTIASYLWDFGDGSTGSGVTPSHTTGYSAAGTYTVTLTVTDDDGAQATDTLIVTVSERPTSEVFTFSGTVRNRKENKHSVIVQGGATSMNVILTWTTYDDLRLRVYNPAGAKVAEVDTSTPSSRVEETTINSPAAGTWKVGAYNENIKRSIPYSIQVTVNY